jgi:hypothetical protein
MVDHIRARDEAAKDANRLLGELLGGLVELSHALYDWHTKQESQRFARLAAWVDDVTDGRYLWQNDGGIEACSPRLGRGWPVLHLDGDSAAIDAALGRVIDVDTRIHDAGLDHVVRRLTERVHPSMRELDLLRFRHSGARIRRSIPSEHTLANHLDAVTTRMRLWRSLDDRVAAAGSHALGHQSAAWPSDAPEPPLPPQLCRAEAELEAHAFECAEILDRNLAETMLLELHVDRVVNYLRRRTAGSALLRTLSAIQK